MQRSDNAPPAVRPKSRRTGGIKWRRMSLFAIIGMLIAGIVLFVHPMFYVSAVEVGGVRYVPSEEIFAESGVANYHILWVRPDEVAQRVAASQSIDSAEARVAWPARVIIIVQEREPALIWQQAGQQYWVDVNGHIMLNRQERPDLVTIVNGGQRIPFQCPGPACPDGVEAVTIDPAIISGALQLKTLRPEVNVLYYDPSHGLSFDDSRGWEATFGTGLGMDNRLIVYEKLILDLQARGITPFAIDVSDTTAPLYQVAE